MIYFIENKGTFQESAKDVIPFASPYELKEHIRQIVLKGGESFLAGCPRIKCVNNGYDGRIGETQWLIIVKHVGIIGMTNEFVDFDDL